VANGTVEEKAEPRGAAPDEEDVGVGWVGGGAPASGAVGGLERERAEGDVAGLHGGEKRQRVFGAGVYGALRRGEHPTDDGEGERRRAAAREHEPAVGAEEEVVARRVSAHVGVASPAGPHRVVVEIQPPGTAPDLDQIRAEGITGPLDDEGVAGGGGAEKRGEGVTGDDFKRGAGSGADGEAQRGEIDPVVGKRESRGGVLRSDDTEGAPRMGTARETQEIRRGGGGERTGRPPGGRVFNGGRADGGEPANSPGLAGEIGVEGHGERARLAGGDRLHEIADGARGGDLGVGGDRQETEDRRQEAEEAHGVGRSNCSR